MLGLLLAAVLLLSALAGCSKTDGESSDAGSAAPDGSGTPAEVKVFNVKDYGAVGDGVTDDYNAVKKALDEAIAYDGAKVVQFEKDAVYLMATRSRNKSAMEIQKAENLTVQGENTTLVIDMDKRVNTYFNINESKNIKVKGFNLKTLKSVYAIADVNSIERATRTIEFTTPDSLGIDATYYASIGDCFGLPYIGEDVNRMHLFFDEMEVVDVGQPLPYPVPQRGQCGRQAGIYAAYRQSVSGAAPVLGTGGRQRLCRDQHRKRRSGGYQPLERFHI